MAQRLIAPLAPGLTLTDGYIVRVTALSPTTGAAVSGVVVSSVAMQVDTFEQAAQEDKIPLLPPLLVSVPPAGAESPGLTRG